MPDEWEGKHGRDVQSTTGGSSQVVKVNDARDAQDREGPLEFTGPGEE